MDMWISHGYVMDKSWLCDEVPRWLPSKLAAWIIEKHRHELGIPPKSSLKWTTAGELNAILNNNLVPSHGGKGQL